MTSARSARGSRALCPLACAALAVSLAVLAVLASPVRAAEGGAPTSAADYASRVERARSAAHDADPDTLAPEAATELAATVHALLPDGERVRVGDGEVEVDASVLGGLATGLASAKTQRQRADALVRLQRHLDSLHTAVGGLDAAERVRSDPKALAALLERGDAEGGPTLAERFGELVQRAIRWLQERLSGVLTPEQSQTVGSTLWTVLIVVLALVLAYVLFRFLVALRLALARADDEIALASEVGRPVVAAAEGLPPDALAYAEELAAAGEYRAAVRALFGGAARRLVEAGVLAQTRTRTDAELLAEVAPAAPRAHPALSLLTADFERAWYGHADPGVEGFARARELYGQVITAVAA